MGLFETPLVLGVVLVGMIVLVALRWRRRRPDEWRDERAHPAAAGAREERSPERP